MRYRLTKKQWAVVIFLIAITTYRFLLIDRGAMGFPDERRHLWTTKAVERLVSGDFRGFCAFLSGTHGRPGDATIRIIPAIGQGILYLLQGTHPRNPDSLKIATGFNVIVSILLLLAFYGATFILFKRDHNIAFIATVVYSLLGNSNFYIRQTGAANWGQRPVFDMRVHKISGRCPQFMQTVNNKFVNDL